MAGNTLGKLFAVTNFGESHGPAVGAVVDGCPAGLQLGLEDIQKELDRRRPGTSRHVTQRRETDTVEILSGVYEGVTTGTPIALLIRNVDARSKDYGNLLETFRPGHADYSYWKKFAHRDPRGGGRSSARLTAPTVAAGAIAKKWLQENYQIRIRGYMSQLGPIVIPFTSWEAVEDNPFFAPDTAIVPELEQYMDALRKEGDSIGARVNVVAEHMPAGLGAPIYDRLDADLAHALMGLNAVKGVEIGAGFDSVTQKGSEHGDAIYPDGFRTNEAGGVLGGISSGQDLRISVAIKPTSSIRLPRPSIDTAGQPVEVQTFGRHDPCVGIRATPIVESLVAIVVMDHLLRQRAQQGEWQPE